MKKLIALALTLFTVSAFATNMEFKLCGAQDNDWTVTVSDTTIVLKDATDELPLPIKQQTVFHPGDLGDSEELVLQLVNIGSYTDGLFLVADGGSSKKLTEEDNDVPVFIFNYGENQKTALLLIGGFPVALGKTEDCKQ